MSRNSGGTYSLPSGNPVVTGTAISSTVHNNTMNDIKTELTDSLSRSNKGAMLAQLQLYSGSESVPGLGWAADTDTGFYYIGPGSIGFAVGGVQVLDIAQGGFAVQGTDAQLWVIQTDAAADEKRWLFNALGGNLSLIAYNDALNAYSSPIVLTRTGTVIDSITLTATSIVLTGSPTAPQFRVSGAAPYFELYETDAAADEKLWRWVSSAGDLYLQTLTDGGGSPANPISLVRTGTVVDSITFAGTQINLNCTAVAVNGNLAVSGTLTANSKVIGPDSGSFTATLASASSGGTTYATGTAYWKKILDVVTITLPSNFEVAALDEATFVFVRGLPAAIRSACAIAQNVVLPVLNAGYYVFGYAEIFTGSVDYMRIKPAGGTGDWEISPGSVCGPAQGATFSYRVAD